MLSLAAGCDDGATIVVLRDWRDAPLPHLYGQAANAVPREEVKIHPTTAPNVLGIRRHPTTTEELIPLAILVSDRGFLILGWPRPLSPYQAWCHSQ